jgi:hypothetical protein
MILIDTSVWIEFFRQNEPFSSQVSTLLAEQKVITVEPVFSELMLGVITAKEKSVITTFWQILPRIEFGADSMFEASSFPFQNNSQEFKIGLIDALIINSAKKGGHLLWTLDERIISIMDNSQLFHRANELDHFP